MGLQQALIVVPTATDIRRTKEYDGAVHYLIEEPYPGSVTIDYISKAMPDLGWKESKETPLKKEGHGARSWGEYYDDSGKTYQWTGSWQNDKGDLITYVLQYQVSDPNAVAKVMKVSGIYTMAATVKRLREAGQLK